MKSISDVCVHALQSFQTFTARVVFLLVSVGTKLAMGFDFMVSINTQGCKSGKELVDLVL